MLPFIVVVVVVVVAVIVVVVRVQWYLFASDFKMCTGTYLGDVPLKK